MTQTVSLLCSICIPTYNRALLLHNTLASLVSQDIFRTEDNIEIVVSDNCSTDTTYNVVQQYMQAFPNKVHYVCTETHVHSSQNFANVLQCAKGSVRKLHNDSMIVCDGFLDDFVVFVRNNVHMDHVLFFCNGDTKTNAIITHCQTLDAFIDTVSFFSTWIGGFAIRDKHIEQHIHHFFDAKHHFAQTEILYTLLEQGKFALVYNKIFCKQQNEVRKGVDINFLNAIFVGEYLPILQYFYAKGSISRATYARVRRNFLLFFYIPYYYSLAQNESHSFSLNALHIKKYIPYHLYCMLHILYPCYCCIAPLRRHTTSKRCLHAIRKLFMKR